MADEEDVIGPLPPGAEEEEPQKKKRKGKQFDSGESGENFVVRFRNWSKVDESCYQMLVFLLTTKLSTQIHKSFAFKTFWIVFATFVKI